VQSFFFENPLNRFGAGRLADPKNSIAIDFVHRLYNSVSTTVPRCAVNRGVQRHPGDAKRVKEILGVAEIRKLGDKV